MSSWLIYYFSGKKDFRPGSYAIAHISHCIHAMTRTHSQKMANFYGTGCIIHVQISTFRKIIKKEIIYPQQTFFYRNPYSRGCKCFAYGIYQSFIKCTKRIFGNFCYRFIMANNMKSPQFIIYFITFFQKLGNSYRGNAYIVRVGRNRPPRVA